MLLKSAPQNPTNEPAEEPTADAHDDSDNRHELVVIRPLASGTCGTDPLRPQSGIPLRPFWGVGPLGKLREIAAAEPQPFVEAPPVR